MASRPTLSLSLSSRASSVVARSRSRSPPPLPKRAPRRISQPRGSVVVDTGIGAVCGLAAKMSPTAPTLCTRLQVSTAAPPPAVMGPPPGVARSPGRRCCAKPRPTFLTPHSRRALPRPRLLPAPLRCPVRLLLLPPSPRLALPAAAETRHRPQAVHRRRRSLPLLPATRSPRTQPPRCLPRNPRRLRASFARGSPQTPSPLEAVDVARHLTCPPRRLKSASFGSLFLSMELAHAIAELVIAGGYIDHWRTNVGPVCSLTHRMRRRITLHQFFAIWWWDLNVVESLLSASQASSS